jgi:hypothetical protein
MNNGEQWTWTIMNENLVMDLKSLDSSGNNTLSTKVLDPLVITHGNGQSSSSMEEFGAADTHHESSGARRVYPDETSLIIT